MATSSSVRADIARRESTPANTTGSFDQNDSTLVQYLGLNPTDPRSRAVVAVCRTYGLDPILKHVIVIPKGGVYITRDGYLHIAHVSKMLDGIVVDQEPTLSEDGKHWVARVSVYRRDMTHPFTFPGRYPVNGQNREYAPEMALKAAESHALRRAFNVAGLGSADERHTEDTPAYDVEIDEPPGWGGEERVGPKPKPERPEAVHGEQALPFTEERE